MPTMADRPYPKKEVAAIFAETLGKPRRPKALSARAQAAIDALAAVLDDDAIEASDRVALGDARAALERYTSDSASSPRKAG